MDPISASMAREAKISARRDLLRIMVAQAQLNAQLSEAVVHLATGEKVPEATLSGITDSNMAILKLLGDWIDEGE